MKARFTHLIIFIWTVLAFSACTDSIEIPDEPEESVAIIYWMGDNNLTSWAEDDIAELVKGKDNIPANSRIVIYVDKASSKPAVYQLDAKNGLKLWKQFKEEQDCTDSLTLLTNLRDIIQNFPARKYGLTFGAHGSGMVIKQRRALGPDNSPSINYLNIPTLKGVLEQLPHLSYIFFDVCFMQSIEVAYELRTATRFLLGSTCEIMDYGLPYTLVFNDLIGETPDYEAFMQKFYNFYSSYRIPSGTFSAIDCKQIEATAELMRTINANFQLSDDSLNVLQYYDGFSPKMFYDMGDYVAKLCTEASFNTQMQKQLKKLVPYKAATSAFYSKYTGSMSPIKTYSGITISDPSRNNKAKGKTKTSWWKATHEAN